MRLWVCALFLICLTGCATVWVHGSKTENDFYADLMDCRQYAQQNAPKPPQQQQYTGNEYTDAQVSGWNAGQSIGYALDSSNSRAQSEEICLKSRGWRKQAR